MSMIGPFYAKNFCAQHIGSMGHLPCTFRRTAHTAPLLSTAPCLRFASSSNVLLAHVAPLAGGPPFLRRRAPHLMRFSWSTAMRHGSRGITTHRDCDGGEGKGEAMQRPRLVCFVRRTNSSPDDTKRKGTIVWTTPRHIELPSGEVNEQSTGENTKPEKGLDLSDHSSNVSGTPTETSLSPSPSPSPPPFPYTAPPARRNSSDGFVFNIFTHRVVRRSAASVRALAILGIGVDGDVGELRVTDTHALVTLRERLLARDVSWPTAWRSAVFMQVRHCLLNARGPDEAVSNVCGILAMHYARARSRNGVGVVSAVPISDVLGSSTAVDVMCNSQERLMTFDDLNDEQQRVVRFVLEGYHTYIGGGAGTGKSLLLRLLRQELTQRGLSVAVTATTGIAAARINGVTLHHCFGVNVHMDFTRRAELRAYDVIIIDEVSMLSRDLFEALEYNLRRANGVDLPFGGVQVILCGDFLQLGAIAAQPLVHSPLFRRHFAMLKLQHVVRQRDDGLFAQQLRELRRGTVPHDLHDTIAFLSPDEGRLTANGGNNAVRLLTTNSEVDAVNHAELKRLPGDAATFPVRLEAPSLAGRWSATYMLEMIATPESCSSTVALDVHGLTAALEGYVMEFVRCVPRAVDLANARLGHRHVVLYRLFADAFAFRVRIPVELDDREAGALAQHLRALESWLPSQRLGVRLREIINGPDGLHTDVDEYTLTKYAENSPMSSPLALKKGCRVMLRTNLAQGLVNGSLGTVVGFKELCAENIPRYIRDVPGRGDAINSYIEYLRYEYGFDTALAPEVDFGDGRVIIVPPTVFYVGGLSNTNHYRMGIIALPLSLAYAFTVHKVQGLTLVGRVHLDLSRMWPCEHLLYVAMSRVRNPEQLTVSSFHSGLVRCASECLVFDDSLPPVERVRVLPHFFPATWLRTPGRRKEALRKKRAERLKAKEDDMQRQQQQKKKKKEKQSLSNEKTETDKEFGTKKKTCMTARRT